MFINSEIEKKVHLDLIKRAILIRKFEEALLRLFSEGKLNGTVHTCIGQEWSAIALAANIKDGDTVFSNHRCHGHLLAIHPEIEGLLAEIMGKEGGLCQGLGGSQHLYYKDIFFSNGIQGGMISIGAGRALANKLKGTGNISVVFIGDGTLGQGVVYEALNVISKQELPVLIVVENNGYAQSTKTKNVLAGDVSKRAAAFEIKYVKGNTWDWQELIKKFGEAVEHIREMHQPVLIEVETYRLKAHSKGDDDRDIEEIESFQKKDPLNKLLSGSDIDLKNYSDEIDQRINLLAESISSRHSIEIIPKKEINVDHELNWRQIICNEERISHVINKALEENLHKSAKIVLIGEDILSPYGGAFKITKGLSDLFPRQVIGTSISEQSIVGLGTGLALSGFIPIVEIMFGDFLALAFDQLLNHACKFNFMYADQVKVPLIIRTPMGGKRGYGPTHSQSIEKHFMGIPDLSIIALNNRISPKIIYDNLIANVSSPTLVIENKVLYTHFLNSKNPDGYTVLFSDELYPTSKITPIDQNPEITILCYGETLVDVESVLDTLFEEYEIVVEIICPSLISPLNMQAVNESVKKTRNLLIIEEGIAINGWGCEIIAQLVESGLQLKNVKRLSSMSYIPSSKNLEKCMLPNPGSIIEMVREFL